MRLAIIFEVIGIILLVIMDHLKIQMDILLNLYLHRLRRTVVGSVNGVRYKQYYQQNALNNANVKDA